MKTSGGRALKPVAGVSKKKSTKRKKAHKRPHLTLVSSIPKTVLKIPDRAPKQTYVVNSPLSQMIVRPLTEIRLPQRRETFLEKLSNLDANTKLNLLSVFIQIISLFYQVHTSPPIILSINNQQK